MTDVIDAYRRVTKCATATRLNNGHAILCTQHHSSTYIQSSPTDGLVQTLPGAQEGEGARQQDVQQDARRPHVHRLAVPLLPDHLGRHEVRGADPSCNVQALSSALTGSLSGS